MPPDNRYALIRIKDSHQRDKPRLLIRLVFFSTVRCVYKYIQQLFFILAQNGS